MGLLSVRLEEAEAAIYNNESSQTIAGNIHGSYMAAYSATAGFVDLDKEVRDMLKFKTPPSDPIVVIAKCTRVMLGDRMIERAKGIAGINNEFLEEWVIPKFTWINGVPGCGKTTWIVRNFDRRNDVVITTTTEAANDLRVRLTPQLGETTKIKVRTMASVLTNGFREPSKRLIIDEALMNHFGSIVMATRLAEAEETLLIGDRNQLLFIERCNIFELNYSRPDSVVTVSQDLLCTRRNPLDVAYALREVYDGIYSSNTRVRSLRLERYSGAAIPKNTKNTLYLTYTQSEKELLKAEGYGTGEGSRVNTIHEAQGSTFETVVVVRAMGKRLQIHDSVPHAVVAVSRHTTSCTYYTDDNTDTIAQFILGVQSASEKQILDYNIKMSLQDGDEGLARDIISIKQNGSKISKVIFLLFVLKGMGGEQSYHRSHDFLQRERHHQDNAERQDRREKERRAERLEEGRLRREEKEKDRLFRKEMFEKQQTAIKEQRESRQREMREAEDRKARRDAERDARLEQQRECREEKRHMRQLERDARMNSKANEGA